MSDVTRLPGPALEHWQWRLHGACLGADSELFFNAESERGPVRDARDKAAKKICVRCPVLNHCREHALTVREPYGVWGGLTAAERNELTAPAIPGAD